MGILKQRTIQESFDTFLEQENLGVIGRWFDAWHYGKAYDKNRKKYHQFYIDELRTTEYHDFCDRMCEDTFSFYAYTVLTLNNQSQRIIPQYTKFFIDFDSLSDASLWKLKYGS